MAWLGRFDDFSGSHEIVQKCKTLDKSSLNTNKTNTFQSNFKMQNQSVFMQNGYHSISKINNSMHATSCIGVIIGKDGPKSVISKRGGNERHLITLTIRDAPDAFINVTCWGGQEYINALSSELSIGAVVEIKDAHVQAKSQNASDDKFKPWTPSTCQLNVSDTQGTVLLYNTNDSSGYTQLLHLPTKANNDFYTLEDVQANGMNLQGEHVNILAAVKKLWPIREILTKSGKSTVKQDVVLCDETCQSFNLTLWGNCTEYANLWVPMETVIFAADVRISFNEFRSAMVACTDSKTIITTSPTTPEASTLLEFIKTQNSFFPSGDFDVLLASSSDPEIGTITKVVTVKQIKSLQENISEENTEYAVMYVFLSRFDIDTDNDNILIKICSKCKKPIQKETNFICGNPDCSGGDFDMFGNKSVNLEYRMSVNLTDHTGTLEHCHIPSHVAAQILGYKPKEFQNVPNSQKTNIKWSYLFERVKAIMKMRKLKKGFHFLVLDFCKVQPNQLLEHAFNDV